jgi:radical SAM superfamily enzyme YgiQ (UPF0313 family)
MSQADLTLILVMPPQTGLLNGFATGLISIANFIQALLPSLQVQLLDLSTANLNALRPSILRSGIALTRNTVVGITTTTASYQSALKTAAAFKNLSIGGVQVTTVLGGHHVSADAETVLRRHHETVDYVVVGEGEMAMAAFLKSYPNVCSTPGLAFLHKDHFHLNPAAPLLNQQQLDSIQISFKDKGLLGTPGKFGHVTYVSARGCPLKCAFCSVANQKIRAKSIAKVIDDVRRLVKMGFSRVAIEDNFFAHASLRTKELCEALVELRRSGLEFTWDCQTRIESMDREGLVTLMENAGCEAVYLGVESLNSDQLVYLNKTPSPDRYLERLQRRVVPSLIESNIQCYINLQFGLPGEGSLHHETTQNLLREIGRTADRLGKVVTIFPMLHVVYPGTYHFQSGVEQGRFTRDIFESFTTWESQQAPVLNWLGKHFAHGTGGIPIGILDPEVLRTGRFDAKLGRVVDPEAVFRIDTILTDLGELPGIRVFKYGTHLVATSDPTETGYLVPTEQKLG